jgi:hypothetical protein
MTTAPAPKRYQGLLEAADKPDAPMYQKILVKAGIVSMLGSKDFQDDHEETVLRRLIGALGVLLNGLESGRKDEFSNSRLYGINQCLHLASSVALLVGNENLTKGRNYVLSEHLVEKTKVDAETLITVATLQLLLEMAALIPDKELPSEVAAKLGRIRRRLRAIRLLTVVKTGWVDCLKRYLAQANWVIGEDAVKALDLYRLSLGPGR